MKASEEIVLAKVKQNDIVGELGIFDNAPRSASAKAPAPTTFLEITTADHFDLFEKNNKIGMVTLRNQGTILASRLRSTDIELRNSLLWIGRQSGPPEE